ncbi:MAG: sugar ABC transporter substrate-binding protein [Candidatus Onthomonas sp.]
MKHPRPSKRTALLLLAVTLIILFAAAGVSLARFQNLMASSAQPETESSSFYSRHFALVVDDEEDPFWASVYAAALQDARACGAYLELTGSGLSGSYDLQERMRMAIAQQVDGILVYPDGSEEMTQLIEDAAEGEIPVVTLMEDDPNSSRQAHVGGNNYDQGQEYGQLICQLCQEQEDEIRQVAVLLDSSRGTSQEILYSAILEACEGLPLTIQAVTVDSSNSFSAEGAIRDLIMSGEERPDLLVCLNDMDTISAYQAVVDYNRVGQVRIIGNYDSSHTLAAIQKGIIYATVTVDPQQLGQQAIASLDEYLSYGRTSGYTTVDQIVITQDTVADYLAQQEAEP